MGRFTAVAVALVVSVPAALTQSDQYRRASIAEILADPEAFHLRAVGVTGTVKRQGDRILISNNDGVLRLLSAGAISDGDVEVRGRLFDVGRVGPEARYLDSYDDGPLVRSAYRNRWPRPGQEIVLVVKSVERLSREIAAITSPPHPPWPLEIEFSVPIADEADVRLNSRIRLQFSRDVEPASLKDRIRITYSRTDSAERGEPQPPAVEFTFNYDKATRALEIKPNSPLERFRRVKLELLEGVVGLDGSVLKPWALNFTTGGS